jgi:beta-apo-4'-carotenal oxygenase
MGGIGSSGMGNYHGYYSFKAFSHQRPIAQTPYWADKLLDVRYMPYRMPDLLRFQRMNHKRPNFDRNGKVIRGLGYWISLLVSLGAKSFYGFLFRWAVLLAGVAGVAVKQGYVQQ